MIYTIISYMLSPLVLGALAWGSLIATYHYIQGWQFKSQYNYNTWKLWFHHWDKPVFYYSESRTPGHNSTLWWHEYLNITCPGSILHSYTRHKMRCNAHNIFVSNLHDSMNSNLLFWCDFAHMSLYCCWMPTFLMSKAWRKNKEACKEAMNPSTFDTLTLANLTSFHSIHCCTHCHMDTKLHFTLITCLTKAWVHHSL